MSSDNTGERAETQTEEERQALWDSTEQWLFGEQFWGIDHALFWAATRDRKAMAKYFAGGHSAETVAPTDPFRLTTLQLWLQERGRAYAKIHDLETAARRGTITIEGQEDGEPVWKPIPSSHWAGGPSPGGLVILEDANRGPYAAVANQVPHRKVWTGLRVRRDQVTYAFPEDEIVRANQDYAGRAHWVRSSGQTIDDILGDAANGLLSESDVETIARKNGWPDPKSSWKEGSPGVFKQDHWNFAMAVAWICWRSDGAVREVWPRWLERHYFWRPSTVDRLGPDGTQVRVSGQVLEPFDDSMATVFRLRNLALSRQTPRLPPPAILIDQGIGDLLSRLRAGDVHAIWRGTVMSPEAWLALTHDGYHDGPQYAGKGGTYALDWEVLIPRFEILKWWRDTSLGLDAGAHQSAWQCAFDSPSAWYVRDGELLALQELGVGGHVSARDSARWAEAEWNRELPETCKPAKWPSLLRASQRKAAEHQRKTKEAALKKRQSDRI